MLYVDHADLAGVVVFQDMVQKYGGATNETVPLFVDDMKRAILGRISHPCVVQFTTFNEGDCWGVFKSKPWDVAGVVEYARSLAPFHLIDTDSGGDANKLGLGDVNDIHDYPDPHSTVPSETQYAMVGEFGGIGAFVENKEWLPGVSPRETYAPFVKSRCPHPRQRAHRAQTDVPHVLESGYTRGGGIDICWNDAHHRNEPLESDISSGVHTDHGRGVGM